MRTEHLDAARREAALYGCAVEFTRSRSHYLARVIRGGVYKLVAVSLCPGDPRAIDNIRRDVRRAAIELVEGLRFGRL